MAILDHIFVSLHYKKLYTFHYIIKKSYTFSKHKCSLIYYNRSFVTKI